MGGNAQFSTQSGLDAALLLDFSQSAKLDCLPILEFPLGQIPMSAPKDHQKSTLLVAHQPSACAYNYFVSLHKSVNFVPLELIIFSSELIIFQNTMEKIIARSLLQINAIKLSPANPFTWASGWKSPIYCDNRKILSFPAERRKVYEAFAKVVAEKYPEADVVAGVATGAIAWGAGAAEILGKPFIYVRSSAKDHGLTNQVEGYYEKGQKVVVIEDLISTGGSSLAAVEALRAAGCEVLGMVAIFTYGFAVAQNNFEKAGVNLTTLSNYNAMIDEAVVEKYVNADQVETLKQWRLSPETWGR